MVDDLLNVSRIRSGRVNMKLENVYVRDILDNLLLMLRESTDLHEFVVDLPPDLPLILVDQTKFGQVLGNLLNNAVKYSPNGGQITISAYPEKERPRVVVKVIASTGPRPRPSEASGWAFISSKNGRNKWGAKSGCRAN